MTQQNDRKTDLETLAILRAKADDMYARKTSLIVADLAEFSEMEKTLAEITKRFGRDYEELRNLLGERFIGPDEIKKILSVKDLGEIPLLPSGLLGILKSDSLMTPGKKVFEDHRLCFMPASFDGTPNSVLEIKALVQRAEAERKKLEPGAKPIFEKDYVWYFKENWAKTFIPKAKWILTPDTVPAETRDIDFAAQSKLIAEKYTPYLRGEAPELISLLSLTELSSKERLYPFDTLGWTETKTDPAGSPRGRRVCVGGFNGGGFQVNNHHPVSSYSWLGAFLCWNFRD